jgi:hypothetical protein
LDLIGTVLITLSLGALTYGTTLAGDTGWRLTATGLTVAGLVLLAVFVLVESRLPDPLLPSRLFTNRVFNGCNIMTFMTYGALSAVLFLFVLNLQVAGHYGALAAGMATLPITVLLLFLSPRAGALSAKIGPRVPMTAGPLIASVGIALTARIDEHHHNYLIDVLPGITVFGLGLACLVAPLVSTVMGSAPPDDVGLASGVNNAVARAASLLAVAVIPPLAGLTGAKYEQPAAMAHSYRLTVLICIGVLIIGAIAVTLTVPNRPPVPEEISDDARN